MASNVSTLADEDGDYSDWIEIYNGGTVAVNLEGWSLTDDPALPGQFVIPAGFGIPPGGYLLVWADETTTSHPTGGRGSPPTSTATSSSVSMTIVSRTSQPPTSAQPLPKPISWIRNRIRLARLGHGACAGRFS